MTVEDVDYLVIGAGIAGSSVAYWLAPYGSTLVLEREAQPGYHSTGRSAAILIDSYGPQQSLALTRASREFFAAPPTGFSDSPLLSKRGVLVVGSTDQRQQMNDYWHIVQNATGAARRIDRDEACQLVPILRPERVQEGIFEPDAADIDTHALHQGFLRGIRRNGGRVHCNASIRSIKRSGAMWHVDAGDHRYQARVIVNAAGAWCDVIAHLAGVAPIGIVPKRRSAFTFATPPTIRGNDWPFFASVDWNWYVKPEGSVLLGSPANDDPVVPHDVQPDELEIAGAIDAIENSTTLQIQRPIRAWAGLRSFVSDEELVGGYDPTVENFFWVAGQGGYGIQTCAAMGEACAALVRRQAIPAGIAAHGVTAAALDPRRLF